MSAFLRWVFASALLCGVCAAPAFGAELHALYLDTGAYPGAEPLPSIRAELERLSERLREEAGVPLERQRIVEGSALDREAIRKELQDLSVRIPRGGRALIYLRAYGTKMGGSALYLYPGAADPSVPPEREPGSLRDSELDGWLRGFFEHAQTFLLLEVHAVRSTLGVYYTNRIQIGTASVHMAALRPMELSLAGLTAEVLPGLAVENEDAAVNIGEVANAVQNIRGRSLDDAAFSGTGEGEAVLYELPSALIVRAAPGSRILVDGADIGPPPARVLAEPGRSYQVSALMEGRRAPDPKTLFVSRAQGETAETVFFLEPIQIRASFALPEGGPPGVLTARLRPDAGFLRELTENERAGFTIDTGKHSLELGQTYDLLVGTPDNRIFGGASFAFGGTQDIDLPVHLERRTAWEVAQIYFEDGFQEHALRTAAEERDAEYAIPPLSEEFMSFLVSAWSSEERNARAMIGSALLSFYLGETDLSKEYWRLAKAAAVENSADYRFASDGLRSMGGGWATYTIIFSFLAVVCSLTFWAVARHRRRLRSSG